MVRIACIMFVVAIIAICFAIARVEKTYIKILIYVLSAVPILLGALLCLAAGVSKYSQTHKRNYFLYDKKLKGDIPLEQLDFETVRSKMADYIDIFKHGGKIYVGELFEA